MNSQMQTLSVRVPAEDIEWLASLEVHFFRRALHVGVTATQQQAAGRTNACADQAEVGRGVE